MRLRAYLRARAGSGETRVVDDDRSRTLDELQGRQGRLAERVLDRTRQREDADHGTTVTAQWHRQERRHLLLLGPGRQVLRVVDDGATGLRHHDREGGGGDRLTGV